MRELARWSVRRRAWVIGGWAVLVLVLVALSRLAGGAAFTTDVGVSGYDSQDARVLLEREFPRAAGDNSRIVVHTASGRVTDPAVRDRVRAMLAEVSRLPHVAGVSDPYAPGGRAVSADGRTAFATVTFDAVANDLPLDAITAVVDAARTARTATIQVELGGQAIARTESRGPSLATVVGLGASVLILLLLFGSVTAMLMPILTTLAAVAAGVSVNSLASHLIDVNAATEAVALMIALGVGVDYSLFVVSRFRDLLAAGHDPSQAAIGAVRTAGRAVLFAGSLVVLALLGMLLLGVGITNGIAVTAAIEVAFTMAASLTLLPAVLSLLGHRADSLRVRRSPAARGSVVHGPGAHDGSRSPRLDAWSRLVRRRRWLFALATVAVLAALTLPALAMRLGSSDAGADPAASTTRKAYDLLTDGFGPGINGPLVLAVAPYDEAVLDRLVDVVGADPAVASVDPPRVNPAGTAAVVQVLSRTAPQSAETDDLVHRLRDTLIPRATAGTEVTVHVGGPTATFVDLASRLASRLVPFMGVVVATGFVVLLVIFRSVTIPLTAAVLNLLSIGAALGVVVAVFQLGWTGLSTGPVHFALPVMMFAIVFGLSTDYQVFLLSRIQEEWHTHHDNTRAVHNGTVRVSGIITGAATIMIAVFGSFVLSGQRFLQEIGVGLAVAVAIDAFLIRFMLVPAAMHILGPWNWWLPRPLAWLPRVHLDPAESPTDASAPRSDVTGAHSLAQRPAVREDRDAQETLTTAGVPIDDSGEIR